MADRFEITTKLWDKFCAKHRIRLKRKQACQWGTKFYRILWRPRRSNLRIFVEAVSVEGTNGIGIVKNGR